MHGPTCHLSPIQVSTVLLFAVFSTYGWDGGGRYPLPVCPTTGTQDSHLSPSADSIPYARQYCRGGHASLLRASEIIALQNRLSLLIISSLASSWYIEVFFSVLSHARQGTYIPWENGASIIFSPMSSLPMPTLMEVCGRQGCGQHRKR